MAKHNFEGRGSHNLLDPRLSRVRYSVAAMTRLAYIMMDFYDRISMCEYDRRRVRRSGHGFREGRKPKIDSLIYDTVDDRFYLIAAPTRNDRGSFVDNS